MAPVGCWNPDCDPDSQETKTENPEFETTQDYTVRPQGRYGQSITGAHKVASSQGGDRHTVYPPTHTHTLNAPESVRGLGEDKGPAFQVSLE